MPTAKSSLRHRFNNVNGLLPWRHLGPVNPSMFTFVFEPVMVRPVERGGRGKVFPGPATFGGPAVARKY